MAPKCPSISWSWMMVPVCAVASGALAMMAATPAVHPAIVLYRSGVEQIKPGTRKIVIPDGSTEFDLLLDHLALTFRASDSIIIRWYG
ncbi:MAG: hypothetical protein PHF64_02550 [Methanoregula sp.]|nr:hypothetical protein [Methanoregula sp.]